MCGLYGFIGEGSTRSKKRLLKGLGVAAKIRGDHATGIAFNDGEAMIISKAAKPANKFQFYIKNPAAVTGHTRHTTQGSEKKNQNNHPFNGSVNGVTFALAHNGVLDNDHALRKSEELPSTPIETDSYIAVQLVEKYGLSMDGLQKMAELVTGMFCFTILDEHNNLYIVRHDSPLHLVYLPDSKLHVYGSTEEIVLHGLKAAGLDGAKREHILVNEGDILKITPNGEIERETFKPNLSGWMRSVSAYSRHTGSTWNYSRYDWMVDEDARWAMYDEGLTEEEATLMLDNFDPEYILDLVESGDLLDALFELLRSEYRWMRKELWELERETVLI